MNKTKYLAVLGTGSDVGKSIVVTALCRIFNNKGITVAPFKAQNMSNNSYVTKKGGEMGRAQVVQAQAACVEPDVHMNPVLLKPSGRTGSQVILQGKPVGHKKSDEYYKYSDFLFEKSLNSLSSLEKSFDLIIMEGAGSCAEVNLRDKDFVNFKMANAVKAPVILVADIDRGGVFAQIIGTLKVVSKEERLSIKGIIINRFRGDAKLFDEGIKYIEEKTGIPVLGLVPYFENILIDSEDTLILDDLVDNDVLPDKKKINIAILTLPYISNFTDFAPFKYEENVKTCFLKKPGSLIGYEILIIPGSKNVRHDMEWIHKSGWKNFILDFVHYGGKVAGICGGYQMLGHEIDDPFGVENEPGKIEGLGLLDIKTILEKEKTLTQCSGIWRSFNQKVEGYEIHMGKTKQISKIDPVIEVTVSNGNSVSYYDGAISRNGKIWGSYFHGLFDNFYFREKFLKELKPDDSFTYKKRGCSDITDFQNKQYELLADHFSSNLNMDRLIEILEEPKERIMF